MSGAEPGEREKKAKPSLVRLAQNGHAARKPPLVSLGSPQLGGAKKSSPLSSIATSPRLGMGLTTFRTPRDLSLGAKPTVKSEKVTERKKFVPNLNVQRLIKKEEEVTKVEKGRGRKERKHEKREKNSRDRPTLIQTGSIFSEGVGGDGVIRRRFGGSAPRDEAASGPALVKPKLQLDQIIDRQAEEEKLKSILRDDFIDDLKEGSFVPVQLPMIDTGKMFKAEVKQEEKDKMNIKPKLIDKKRSVLDSDDSEEELDNPEPVIDATTAQAAAAPGLAQLLTQQSGELLFFQLPDRLPLNPVDGNAEEHSAGAGSGSDQLAQLEGQLGRLQIRKSGRCQLVLGNQLMDVEIGTKAGFLQDAVSIRVAPNSDAAGGAGESTTREGQLTVLGHITNRLVVTPDWDSLLRESGLDDTLA